VLSGEVVFVVTKKIVPHVASFTHTHTHTNARVAHVIGLVRTPVNMTANNCYVLLMLEITQKTYGLTNQGNVEVSYAAIPTNCQTPTTRHDLTLQIRLLITNTMLIYNLATNLHKKKKRKRKTRCSHTQNQKTQQLTSLNHHTQAIP